MGGGLISDPGALQCGDNNTYVQQMFTTEDASPFGQVHRAMHEVGFNKRKFDLQPAGEAVVVAPDLTHLRTCVSLNNGRPVPVKVFGQPPAGASRAIRCWNNEKDASPKKEKFALQYCNRKEG